MSPNPYTVPPAFWTEPGIRALPLHTKLIGLYIVNVTPAGTENTCRLRLAELATATGCNLVQCAEALDQLAGIGFAFYDAGSETIWVPAMARLRSPGPAAPTIH